MEHDTVHDTEELENYTNKNITNIISENKNMMNFLMKQLILIMLKR